MSYKTYGSLVKKKEVIPDSPSNVRIIDSEKTKGDLIHESASTGKLLVVDIYGDFCGPCKMIKPRFNQLSLIHQNVIFATEDVGLEISPHVIAVPFFEFWGFGKVLETIKGADMAAVEASIAKYVGDKYVPVKK